MLKGRSNYKCLITDVSVDDAPCQIGFSCDEKGVCPYFIDREEAFEANYAVFNYALFMNTSQFSDTFEPPELLFCDEAHLAASELEKFITASISDTDIRKEKWQRPLDETVHGLSTWAESHMSEVGAKVIKARKHIFAIIGNTSGNKILGSQFSYKKAVKAYNKYRRLERTLTLFFRAGLDTENGRTWLYEKTGPIHEVRPVYVDEYNEALFGDVEKIVLMSATIGHKDMETLGVDKDEYEMVSVGSSFNVERRPIYYAPVASVTRKTESEVMPMIVHRMDTLISNHLTRGQSGIIHTVSFKRADEIKDMSKHSSIMLTHTTDNKDEIIGEFKNSNEPRVLLSPSIIEGEDFPFSECSFILIPKVPYLSLGDKVVKERMDKDPDGYTWKAVQDIIQGSGRGMRNESDVCSIYILDRQFEKLLEKHENEIPKWFRDAIVDWKW